MSIKSEELMRIETMPKMTSSKVTIEVPADQYKLLYKIKQETGKSIRALVTEGVPLVILENEDIIEKSKDEAISEAVEMEKTLANLKKDKSKK